MSWANKRWHYDVHRRYDEELVYYRIHLGAFSRDKVSTRLTAALAEQHIRSFRGYMIFGRHDLLLRGWVHKRVHSDLPYALFSASGTDTKPESFVVSKFYEFKHDLQIKRPKANDPLWRDVLTPSTVRALQTGANDTLLDNLLKAGFVVTAPDLGQETIRFFCALRFTNLRSSHVDALAAQIFAELKDRPTLIRPGLFAGVGFCDLMIRGEVHTTDYFAVGKLTDWLLGAFHDFGLTTETYLVTSSDPLVGNSEEPIDDRTFIENRGRQPFVVDLIPDVYDYLTPQSDKIIDFILKNVVPDAQELFPQNKLLIQHVLNGYLKQEPARSAATCMIFFAEHEEFFRNYHAEFFGRHGFKVGDVYRAANTTKSEKLALSDLMGAISKGLEMIDKDKYQHLIGNWNGFAELRNVPAHTTKLYDNWEPYLEKLIRFLPRVRKLVALMAELLKIDPQFTY